MALQLVSEYVTPHGLTVPSTYWRWVGLGVDVTAQSALVTLYAYVNAEAFAAGKQPIGQQQVQLTGQEFMVAAGQLEAPDNGGLSAVIYAYVKQLPEFAGATEV